MTTNPNRKETTIQVATLQDLAQASVPYSQYPNMIFIVGNPYCITGNDWWKRNLFVILLVQKSNLKKK